jgi:hypothetical protein
MADPPNPVAGYFYNVYLHNGSDIFKPHGWAMGQGTDENKYPYLTFPIAYAKLGNSGVRHEGFHIFQYRANSPGFTYSGDSQWFIEATANWYAATKRPGSVEEYVTASAVTANPQVPMWYSFENQEPGDKSNWQRGCHQYGMNILLNYLTDVRKVSKRLIAGGFYAKTKLLPQEYLYEQLGASKFCDLYADFASHNVGGYKSFPAGTEARAAKELKVYGDSLDIHDVAQTYKNGGTDGNWYRPSQDVVTRGWSYNVFKIENSSEGFYSFDLKGDKQGSAGAAAEFRGRLVVKSGNSVKTHRLAMSSATDGKIRIKVKTSDAELYLIVVSTPRFFKGNQTYSYQIKINREPLTRTT